ncbi:MAG: tRNA (adenosine(37)-N6)-threonylcarbamoyltransferase complex transferase subunit TsaD [Bdellovibrionales bacterium]|nr:tRNA (adenosine(37)-N6)-threonylcarbamoyltransferase complex transferase subunit TsaD [Bdellovibrionales bacterium]
MNQPLNQKKSLILGIETSCDECSASVMDAETFHVLSLATFSQIQIHRPYGGVVPEIASRNHLETINPMMEEARAQAGIQWSDISAVAVTNRPGLVGALLVGVSAAKAFSYARDLPLIPVHHLEGHALSPWLDQTDATRPGAKPGSYPMLIAIVSGGHTNLYVAKEPPENWPVDFLQSSCVGRSRDDAAGEAFDKTAKILGFPYPGGRWIDQTARGGNPKAFDLPRGLNQKDSTDFSFSGMKTATLNLVQKLQKAEELETRLSDVCASIQEAIVDALVTKIFRAVQMNGCKTLALVGGVSANSRLRARLDAEWKSAGLAHEPFFPKMKYCTDNAAMIAAAGAVRFKQGHFLRIPETLSLNAWANPNH